jgi:hypothetical protein
MPAAARDKFQKFAATAQPFVTHPLLEFSNMQSAADDKTIFEPAAVTFSGMQSSSARDREISECL